MTVRTPAPDEKEEAAPEDLEEPEEETPHLRTTRPSFYVPYIPPDERPPESAPNEDDTLSRPVEGGTDLVRGRNPQIGIASGLYHLSRADGRLKVATLGTCWRSHRRAT